MMPNLINLVTKRVLVWDQPLANCHIFRKLSRISIMLDTATDYSKKTRQFANQKTMSIRPRASRMTKMGALRCMFCACHVDQACSSTIQACD